jgi:hypothetical protein
MNHLCLWFIHRHLSKEEQDGGSLSLLPVSSALFGKSRGCTSILNRGKNGYHHLRKKVAYQS